MSVLILVEVLPLKLPANNPANYAGYFTIECITWHLVNEIITKQSYCRFEISLRVLIKRGLGSGKWDMGN